MIEVQDYAIILTELIVVQVLRSIPSRASGVGISRVDLEVTDLARESILDESTIVLDAVLDVRAVGGRAVVRGADLVRLVRSH